ncbi:MAG TPA: cysteine hydrolase family protein [Blastocatellia bacterium]|nr:cysteine hydrolase family protein [Blastocatellia bacterium]
MKPATALVIIDVQAGIIGLPVTRAAETLGRINLLLERARTAGTPVIYVQHDGPAGHPVEAGTAGWQIHAAIAPRPGEPVIHKRNCDSFFESALQSELARRNISHLVIAGCMTEYCVDTACRRAVSLGYDVTLAADAHTTADTEALTAAQIIRHHNALLEGFSAGGHSVSISPAHEISF